MTRALFALILFALLPSLLPAQAKVVRGNSDAQSGMLYYDIEKATDQQKKRFLYTICPEEIHCMQLDFTLVQSALEADFIRIYPGVDASEEPIQSFGGITRDKLFQFNGNCLTVEFLRDEQGLNSAWTLLWKSEKEGECIRSGKKDDDCPYITEICGPVYQETFKYFKESQVASQAVFGSCLDQPKRSSWYKFQAQQDGPLAFAIKPANGKDDYDWVLWRADSTWANPCPDSLLLTQKLACNFAAGLGSAGSTGMNTFGSTLETTASGNPFARPVDAKKGDIFFLLLNDYSRQSQGFSIKFNEVVLACENPVRTFVAINHAVVSGQPKVPVRNQFSRYTAILRIPLNEKNNQPLGNCDAGEVAWDELVSGLERPLVRGTENPLGGSERQLARAPEKPLEAGLRIPGTGIHAAILNGLKLGRYQGYSCEDMASPVHYGDMLDFASLQLGEEVNWERPDEALAGFGNYIELIVDEIFDRTTARRRQQIRMVRLVWSDESTNLPDYNIAVFQWEDIAGLLDQVSVPNPHNDVSSLSVKDFLEGQFYTSIHVHQRHRNNRTPEEAEDEAVKEIEFEAYHWDR